MFKLRFLLFLGVVALIGGLVVYLTAEAHVHSRGGQLVDASWILKHHPTCCGPIDCWPVPGLVRLTKLGWKVNGVPGFIPKGKTLVSIDEKPWACSNDEGLNCLFLPGAFARATISK